MEARIQVVGNLTADAQVKTKTDKTEYLLLQLCANRRNGNEEIPEFYTAFVYGVSEARTKLLTKGSLIYVYGTYRDEISQNPNTQEKQINRVINVKDFEILYTKKHDDQKVK